MLKISLNIIKQITLYFGKFLLICGLVVGAFIVQGSQLLKTKASESVFSEGEVYSFPFAFNTPEGVSGPPWAVYDPVSNQTFITYISGITTDCAENIDECSATSPYIIVYDHNTHTWSEEVEVTRSPVHSDYHNYTQLVIDDNGYLHLFQTHHGNHNITHAVSQKPRDISEWDVSYIPDTNLNTYGHTYKAQNGDVYLVFRNSTISTPNPDGTHEFYLPWKLIKTSDIESIRVEPQNNNQNWIHQNILDPGYNDDDWNSIYLTGIKYHPDPEGLHIVFIVTLNQTEAFDKQYYVFYSFADNHVYGPDGQDFGKTITRNELYQALLYEYGERNMNDYAGSHSGFFIDEDKKVNIVTNKVDVSTPGVRRSNLEIARRVNGVWEIEVLDEFGSVGRVLEIDYRSDNDIDLYLERWVQEGSPPVDIYHFSGLSWSLADTLDHFSFNPQDGLSTILLLQSYSTNYNPEIKGTYHRGSYVNGWLYPAANGTVYAFGEEAVLDGTRSLLGDINNDDVVNIQDYILLSNAFGTNDEAADLDGNGIVNIQDFIILSNNFGKTN